MNLYQPACERSSVSISGHDFSADFLSTFENASWKFQAQNHFGQFVFLDHKLAAKARSTLLKQSHGVCPQRSGSVERHGGRESSESGDCHRPALQPSPATVSHLKRIHGTFAGLKATLIDLPDNPPHLDRLAWPVSWPVGQDHGLGRQAPGRLIGRGGG